MSFAFVPPVEAGSARGRDVAIWVEEFWDPDACFTGPWKDRCLIFRNLCPLGTREGVFLGDPVHVQPYETAMVETMRAKAAAFTGVAPAASTAASTTAPLPRAPRGSDPVTRKRVAAERQAILMQAQADREAAARNPGVMPLDVVVPLGCPVQYKGKCRTVLQQAARLWVSAGTNRAQMDDRHVIVMLFCALESLLANLQAWVPEFVALLRTACALCQDPHFPLFGQVTKALTITPGADDMVQKALAHIMDTASDWDSRTILEMLELIVRRSSRRRLPAKPAKPGPASASASSLLTAASTALLLVQPLRTLLTTKGLGDVHGTQAFVTDTLASLDATFSRRVQERPLAVKGVRGCRAWAVTCLANMAGVGGFTVDHALELAAFLARERYVDASAPWATWGLVHALQPRSDRAMPLRTAKFPYKGSVTRGAFAARMTLVHEDDKSLCARIVGFKGVIASGVQLLRSGSYEVTLHPWFSGDVQVPDDFAPQWALTFGEELCPTATRALFSNGEVLQRNAGTGAWRRTLAHDTTGLATNHVHISINDTHVTVNRNKDVRMPIDVAQPVLFVFVNTWVDVTFCTE